MSAPQVVNLKQSGGVLYIVGQLVGELEQFLQSRGNLFRVEVRQKLPHLLNAVRLGIAGGLLLLTGYLFLAIAVVVLIGAAFPQSPYRWFFGFLIVGIISLGFGAVGVFLARAGLDLKSIVPQRTLNVLKRDQDWIMSETQNMADSHPQK